MTTKSLDHPWLPRIGANRELKRALESIGPAPCQQTISLPLPKLRLANYAH